MMNMLNMFLLTLKLRAEEFFTNEDGDTNIVSMVVLIGIAVLLAIVFKDAIAKLIKDLLDAISGNASNAATQKIN
jgi:hypothetical protein